MLKETYLMVVTKSLDKLVKLIGALLCDVHTKRSDVFNQRQYRLTIQKIEKRTSREGIGFLTKSLPRLGKALESALTGEHIMDAASLGFKPLRNSKLPIFMGELFQLVFDHDGKVLPSPCVASIRELRQILYLFYKYEIPYSAKQEQNVLTQFLQSEQDIKEFNEAFNKLAVHLETHAEAYSAPHCDDLWWPPAVDCQLIRTGRRVVSPFIGYDSSRFVRILRIARSLLTEATCTFDPVDIHPKHGPGAVSQKERLWGKYYWTSVSSRITSMYPLDAYFYASNGHVCDAYREFSQISEVERSARIIFVPKDSRGPRLISAEPLEFQWIQQGLGRALVHHIEQHPLTRYSVHFSDQRPNQLGALLGSLTGQYATLDLKEASDRVSVGLVRLLWPGRIFAYLSACRSLATRLPDGSELPLEKFAPMGSCLCFPVMALTIWALVTAGLTDAHLDSEVLVYGDDVVVPTAGAANAIEVLEAFGLKVNRAKSFVTGSFRESCGVDAMKGEDVTPIKLRTAWPTSPSPESYVSWIEFSNHMYDRKYFNVYEMVTEQLFKLYGPIPDEEQVGKTAPSLRYVPKTRKPQKWRINRNLQKKEWLVRTIETKPIRKSIDGWRMLLRYFAEATNDTPLSRLEEVMHDRVKRRPLKPLDSDLSDFKEPFMVSSYTRRNTSKLVWRWR
jgi:hypothetical protein